MAPPGPDFFLGGTLEVKVELFGQACSMVHIPRSRIEEFSGCVAKFFAHPPPAYFLSITTTVSEMTIIGDEEFLEDLVDVARQHANPLRPEAMGRFDEALEVSEAAWRVFEVETFIHYPQRGQGQEGLASSSRIRRLSEPLAAAGIPILWLTSHESDYILVQSKHLDQTLENMQAAGYTFTHQDDYGLPPEDDKPVIVEGRRLFGEAMIPGQSVEELDHTFWSPSSGSYGNISVIPEGRKIAKDLADARANRSGSLRPKLKLSTRTGSSFESTSSSPTTRRITLPSPSPSVNSVISISGPPAVFAILGVKRCPGTLTKLLRLFLFPEAIHPFLERPKQPPSQITLDSKLKGLDLEFAPNDDTRPRRVSAVSSYFQSPPLSPLDSAWPSGSATRSRSGSGISVKRLGRLETTVQTLPFSCYISARQVQTLVSDVHTLAMLFPNRNDRFEKLQGASAAHWFDDFPRSTEDFSEYHDLADISSERSRLRGMEKAATRNETYRCIQIDLREFELDKVGVISHLSTLLHMHSINHVFFSSFKTTSILVPCEDADDALTLLTSTGI